MAKKIFNQEINEHGDIPLIDSIIEGNVEEVKSTLSSLEESTFTNDITSIFQNNTNIMHYVADSGNAEIIELFLKKIESNLTQDQIKQLFNHKADSGLNPLEMIIEHSPDFDAKLNALINKGGTEIQNAILSNLQQLDDEHKSKLKTNIADSWYYFFSRFNLNNNTHKIVKKTLGDDSTPIGNAKEYTSDLYNSFSLNDIIKTTKNYAYSAEKYASSTAEAVQAYAYSAGNYIKNSIDKEGVETSQESTGIWAARNGKSISHDYKVQINDLNNQLTTDSIKNAIKELLKNVSFNNNQKFNADKVDDLVNCVNNDDIDFSKLYSTTNEKVKFFTNKDKTPKDDDINKKLKGVHEEYNKQKKTNEVAKTNYENDYKYYNISYTGLKLMDKSDDIYWAANKFDEKTGVSDFIPSDFIQDFTKPVTSHEYYKQAVEYTPYMKPAAALFAGSVMSLKSGDVNGFYYGAQVASKGHGGPVSTAAKFGLGENHVENNQTIYSFADFSASTAISCFGFKENALKIVGCGVAHVGTVAASYANDTVSAGIKLVSDITSTGFDLMNPMSWWYKATVIAADVSSISHDVYDKFFIDESNTMEHYE